jgi:hypothetical protein
MKPIFDTNHPFFVPLWRRIAIVAFCLGWALLEFSFGEDIWMAGSLAISAWLIWAFFVVFKPRKDE